MQPIISGRNQLGHR